MKPDQPGFRVQVHNLAHFGGSAGQGRFQSGAGVGQPDDPGGQVVSLVHVQADALIATAEQTVDAACLAADSALDGRYGVLDRAGRPRPARQAPGCWAVGIVGVIGCY